MRPSLRGHASWTDQSVRRYVYRKTGDETNEANALRKLGRKDEAEQIEERLRKIHRAAQTN